MTIYIRARNETFALELVGNSLYHWSTLEEARKEVNPEPHEKIFKIEVTEVER